MQRPGHCGRLHASNICLMIRVGSTARVTLHRTIFDSGNAYHEGEREAVEGAGSSIVHAVSTSPQLDQPHQRAEAAVNVCQVAQHCGLEPCSPACHTDVTLNTCKAESCIVIYMPRLCLTAAVFSSPIKRCEIQALHAKFQYRSTTGRCRQRVLLAAALAAELSM